MPFRWPALLVTSAVAAAACQRPDAALVLEAESPATADPLVFHGNCFTGWQVAADVAMRERGGAELVVDEVTYRIEDQGAGVEIVDTFLAGEGLDERAGGRNIGPRSMRRVRLSGLSVTRPLGPVRVQARAIAHEDSGENVTARLDVVLPLRVAPEPPLGSGACGPGVSPPD